MIAQYILGASSYDNATLILGEIAYGIALDCKQLVDIHATAT
jgi:hypothetical protein